MPTAVVEKTCHTVALSMHLSAAAAAPCPNTDEELEVGNARLISLVNIGTTLRLAQRHIKNEELDELHSTAVTVRVLDLTACGVVCVQHWSCSLWPW